MAVAEHTDILLVFEWVPCSPHVPLIVSELKIDLFHHTEPSVSHDGLITLHDWQTTGFLVW